MEPAATESCRHQLPSPLRGPPPRSCQPTRGQVPTFRCSATLRGWSGVRLAPAAAPARGEALGFPGMSAGMVRPFATPSRGQAGRAVSQALLPRVPGSATKRVSAAARLFKAARLRGVGIPLRVLSHTRASQ